MYRLRWLAAAAAALAAALLPAGTAYAGSGGQLRIEKSWYDGHEVTFLQPSLFSAKPNGGVLPSAAQVRAALNAGTLRDVTSTLAPGPPVTMVAPVIGGS